MPTHLLTIPREIRDNIYSHLHQPVTCNWTWEQSGRSYEISMQINNAPLFDVFFVNRQLYDEYSDHSRVQGYNIHLTWKNILESSPSSAEGHSKLLPVLTHIRHLTLFVDEVAQVTWEGYVVKLGQISDVCKTQIVDLSETIAGYGQALCSIKVALRFSHGLVNQWGIEERVPETLWQSSYWPQLELQVLGGLRRRHKFEDHHIDYDYQHWEDKSWIDDEDVPVYRYTMNKRFHRKHCVFAFVYAQVPSDRPCWEPKDILTHWTPCDYPPDAHELYPHSAQDVEKFRKRIWQMMDWQET